MSKIIVISTDDMREFLKENFNDFNIMHDFYCHNCHEIHRGCPSKESECYMTCDDKVIDFFIENKFANYMIPFS